MLFHRSPEYGAQCALATNYDLQMLFIRAIARTRRGRRHDIPPSTGLAAALRRAEVAHGEHKKRIGQRDANWPDWYAEYIVREQAGKQLPS